MELPDNIEYDILEYLHLEYGEEFTDEDSLKVTDLKYEGVFTINGESTHCWSYPSARDSVWATVTAGENGYSIGMAEIPSERRAGPYKYLKLQVSGNKNQSFKIPYVPVGECRVSSFEKDFYATLDNGEEIMVSSEIFFSQTPIQVTVSIVYGGQEIYLKFGLGLEMLCKLNGTEIYLQVGDLSWRDK